MDKLINIALINVIETVNAIGEPEKTETETKVRGVIDSITRDEWFSAYKADINARHRVTVYEFEYHGEQVAIINGQRFAIYRTYYKDGDKIELYLGEKGGV